MNIPLRGMFPKIEAERQLIFGCFPSDQAWKPSGALTVVGKHWRYLTDVKRYIYYICYYLLLMLSVATYYYVRFPLRILQTLFMLNYQF